MQKSGDSQLIRAMTEKDLDGVMAIEKASFHQGWSEKSFLDAMLRKDTVYLVEEAQGQIRGYCGIWLSLETADLCNIAVSKVWRRRGIGQALLLAGMQTAGKMGAERILLEVRMGNQSAIGLYEKLGYRHLCIRKGYYSNPKEDALIMECTVSNVIK